MAILKADYVPAAAAPAPGGGKDALDYLSQGVSALGGIAGIGNMIGNAIDKSRQEADARQLKQYDEIQHKYDALGLTPSAAMQLHPEIFDAALKKARYGLTGKFEYDKNAGATLGEALDNMGQGGTPTLNRADMPQYRDLTKMFDENIPGWQNKPYLVTLRDQLKSKVGDTLDPAEQSVVGQMISGYNDEFTKLQVMQAKGLIHEVDPDAANWLEAVRKEHPEVYGQMTDQQIMDTLANQSKTVKAQEYAKNQQPVSTLDQSVAAQTTKPAVGEGVAVTPASSATASDNLLAQGTSPAVINRVQQTLVPGQTAPGYIEQIKSNPQLLQKFQNPQFLAQAYNAFPEVLGKIYQLPPEKVQAIQQISSQLSTGERIDDRLPKTQQAAAAIKQLGFADPSASPSQAVNNFLSIREGFAHTSAVNNMLKGTPFNAVPDKVYMPSLDKGTTATLPPPPDNALLPAQSSLNVSTEQFSQNANPTLPPMQRGYSTILGTNTNDLLAGLQAQTQPIPERQPNQTPQEYKAMIANYNDQQRRAAESIAGVRRIASVAPKIAGNEEIQVGDWKGKLSDYVDLNETAQKTLTRGWRMLNGIDVTPAEILSNPRAMTVPAIKNMLTTQQQYRMEQDKSTKDALDNIVKAQNALLDYGVSLDKNRIDEQHWQGALKIQQQEANIKAAQLALEQANAKGKLSNADQQNLNNMVKLSELKNQTMQQISQNISGFKGNMNDIKDWMESKGKFQGAGGKDLMTTLNNANKALGALGYDTPESLVLGAAAQSKPTATTPATDYSAARDQNKVKSLQQQMGL